MGTEFSVPAAPACVRVTLAGNPPQVIALYGRYARGVMVRDDKAMQDVECELLCDLAFEARASALTEMRRQVSEALARANCTPSEIQSIVIAVNEACMNIIQHAYQGDSCKPIRLSIELNDDDVRFEILDCAPPVDLSQVRGRSLGQLRPGGLGVNFIAQLMNDVRYSHRTENAGNCLRMTWKRRSPVEEK